MLTSPILPSKLVGHEALSNDLIRIVGFLEISSRQVREASLPACSIATQESRIGHDLIGLGVVRVRIVPTD